jgi:hypothetical protein
MTAINNDTEALNYIDKTIRRQLVETYPNIGSATIKDKFGIGHHSDPEKVVHAWAYTFEGLPELSTANEEWKNRKNRWLLSTGETLEATHEEVNKKILTDNPDFDASTEPTNK